MSQSKMKKITLSLLPNQCRKLREKLNNKQLYWNNRGCEYNYLFYSKNEKYLVYIYILFFVSVLIHLDYQDVDPMFISGMLSEVLDEYSGKYCINVPEQMKYPPQIEYA